MRKLFIQILLFSSSLFLFSACNNIQSKAEKGDAEAQYTLGVCYYTGNGVEQDYVQAAEWFLKAAEQGSVYAQQELGKCYQKGLGVAQDSVQAEYWYNLAKSQEKK